MADYEPAPFYAPWPLFGKKFSAQLGEIRANQDALAPIVKSTGYDLTDVADLRGSGVMSREWGEENFHNKFRIRWHKGAEDVEFQCNRGTEAVPNWETYFYIGCASRDINAEVALKAYNDFWVTGDFYINGTAFASAGESNTASNLTGDEGVFGSKSGVDLRFKSLTAGEHVSLSSDTNAVTIAVPELGPGFYGVNFKETKAGGPSFKTDTLSVDSEFFYLGTGGDGNPVLSSTNQGGSGETNTASNLAGDEGVFSSKSGVDLRFKSLTAGSNITLASDANAITITGAAGGGGGGFYGVLFKETHETATTFTETLSFSDNLDGTSTITRTSGASWIQDGYILGTFVTTSGTKTINGTITAINDAGDQITVNDSAGTAAGSSTASGTGPGGRQERDDALNFDANLFYLHSGSDGKPILSGFGVNTASNLAGDEGLFSSKKRQDLRFKSLTAGDNITLSSTTNAITITGEVGIEDIPPGFYGVNYKESKAGGSSYTTDTLTFDSAFFYISTGGDGNPIVSEVAQAGSGETNTASNLAGDEGVFASKSGVDLRFKSLTAGTNITLSSDANAITINSSGGSASDNTISARGFYVRSGGELSNEGLIVPVGSAGDPSITFEGDSDTGLFQENTNEVNITCGGNHILECRSTTVIAKQRIQVPNGSAASPTLNPTSGSNTGIFFGSGASSVGVSVLGGEVAHFGPGGVNVANKVQAEAFYTPSDGEVGPIRFEETKSGGPSYFVKTLNFDSEFFYLSSGGDGLPILSSIPAAGSGEANTASNLAGDEGVFASKSGVDLRFKSLTAGDNITLASDGNAITITGAAGGGGGGFYGVIFKETEAGGAVMRDDQLNVDSEYMYLSGGGDGKPILSLTGVPKFHSHVQAAAAVEWQVSHGLNSSRLIAQAWDDGNHLVTADKIDTSDPATAYFYFNPATAGFAQLTGIPNL